METVGQLSGGIAHDFNNLLTVIIGNAELLSEQLKARPDLRQFADDICESGERGAELTQRLLAFSRRQLLQPKAIDCRELLRVHAQAAQAHLARKHRDQDGVRSWHHPGLCRPRPARIRRAEPCAQRAGRHAIRRPSDAEHGARRNRRGLSRPAPGSRIRRLRADFRHRRRRRHDARGHRARLRAVLHHQGGRQGLRARSEHGLWLRKTVRRPCLDL